MSKTARHRDYSHEKLKFISIHLERIGRIVQATYLGECASMADLDTALRYVVIARKTEEAISLPPFGTIYTIFKGILPEALAIKRQTDPEDWPP
jgi:hypothetical protein